MAVYKVIQDVEADDKVLGPLSIKQLIYAAVAAGLVFLAFRIVTATGSIFLAIPFLPFVLVLGALAAPLSRDQTTEIWLAAQIRFFTKPRKRLWDQDGMKELVHITVPKREEKHYTDGLDQTQVRSRLTALASTLDSRGWAVRHADLNAMTTPGVAPTQSDRLIDPSSLPQPVSDNPVTAADDILDVTNNQVAQHFDEMMRQSGEQHKQLVKEKMLEPAAKNNPSSTQQPPEDYYFMHESKPNQPIKDGQAMFDETVVQPGAQTTVATAADDSNLTEEEKAALEHAKVRQKTDEFANYNHHKVILTPAQLEEQAKANAAIARQQAEEARKKAEEEKAKAQATHLKKADTIELVDSNLKVSTIAGLAKHKTKKSDTDEVVINLH